MSELNNQHSQQPQIIIQAAPEGPPSNEESSGLDLSALLEYYYMVRSRLWLFLVVPAIILVAAFIKVYQSTPIYESSCQLQIQPRPVQVSGVQGFYDPMAGARDFSQFVNTEIELMRTPDILNRAFEEMKLVGDAEFATGSPVGKLIGNLRIGLQSGTFLINVSYRSPDPEKAARIANFLGNLYVQSRLERKRNISGGGITKLREQLDSIAVARNQALKELAAFKADNGLMDLDYERQLVADRIGALTEILIEAEMDGLAARDIAETVAIWKEQGHLGAVIQLVDNSFVSSFRLEQLRAEVQLPELLSKFGRGHSSVKTQEQIIENLKQAVENEIETSVIGLKLTAERAVKRREIVTAEIAKLEARLVTLDGFGAEFFRLRDTYDAAQNAYRKVISRINDVDISVNTEQLEGTDFLSVVRRATPRYTAIWPNKRKTLANALMLGLVLGAGACILLGMLDTSVKGQEDVTRYFKEVPVLGTIPSHEGNDDELIAVNKPQGAMAEAFRGIRTSLSLCLSGRHEKCFAVTSAGPGDGKTTTAFNLALAMVRSGKRVLLLEADMRRPRLLKFLADQGPGKVEIGLSSVLIGDAELQDVTFSFPGQEGFDLVPCGAVPPNPAELMGTDRFKEIIAQAKEQYDVIILDAPPLLNVADAAVIAGSGVSLLFVVRLLRTTRHELRLAAEQLRTIQANCAGLLLNSSDTTRHGRYYGKYRYGYRAGRHYQAGYQTYGYGGEHDPDNS